MKSVRHIARAAGRTGSSLPAYRADIRVRGHDLVADEPNELGGGDVGPAPFELLVSALVACTAITLRMYASRQGWELTNTRDARTSRWCTDQHGDSTRAHHLNFASCGGES